MASNTDYLPDEITYGFVADRVLLAVGDTTGDDDRFPDGVPAQGTVRFSPERTILYTQQRPATVLPQDIECTIYHRDHPVAVNEGYNPELVGKLVDPAGHVGNVALIVGWYEAVYRLETGTAQRFRFKVLPEHTADNPLWLPSVAPLTPTPSERFVVNEQVYNDTKTARDETVEYRDAAKTHATAAQTARTGAETAETNAGTHATASATSASTAADILEANQALGITVDTSVGTRVYVGDTMIHGDTGWRDVSTLLEPEWENIPDMWQSFFLIRRIGDVVYMTLRVSVVDGDHDLGRYNTNTPIARLNSLAQGFAFPNTYHSIGTAEYYSSVTAAGSSDVGMTYAAAGAVLVRFPHKSGSWSQGQAVAASSSWPTSDPWPTSLPGVPA